MTSRRASRAAWLRLVAALLPALLLQGCWDEIDMTDQGYVSALGVDYVDGQYVVYTQLIQFKAIAKQKGAGPGNGNVWVGTAKGKTLLTAMGNLQRTSQFVLNMEHLKAMIVHERALPLMSDILDANNRQRASRYTTLVFGTRGPIAELLQTESFFGSSPLLSVLYNPSSQYAQSSYIRPISMQELVRFLDEEGFTTMLPSLKLDKGNWLQSDRELKVQAYDGLFAFTQRKFKRFLPLEDTEGFRWIDPSFLQYVVNTKSEEDGGGGDKQGQPNASVSITRSRPRVSMAVSDGEPHFRMEVSLEGHVVELDGNLDEQEITRQVEEAIRSEIMDTFRKGCETGVDVLLLGDKLYRDDYPFWKRLNSGREWIPKPGQLEAVVKLELIHTGNFNLS